MIVVGGTKKGERSDQGSGADSCYEFEFWAGARRSPTVEETRAESSVIATARQRKKCRGRKWSGFATRRQMCSLPIPGLDELFGQRGLARSVADAKSYAFVTIGQRNMRPVKRSYRDCIEARQRGAGSQEARRGDQDPHCPRSVTQ